MAINIITDVCTGCGRCINACPVNALKMKKNVVTVNRTGCSECGSCVTSCPVQAIEID